MSWYFKATLSFKANVVKVSLLIITTNSFFSLLAQTGNDFVHTQIPFRITHFNPNGRVSYTERKDVVWVQSLDIKFYSDHFNLRPTLPPKLINSNYKSQTIEVWHDSMDKGNIKTNWEDTYTYDSLSRLVACSYSGCLICNMQTTYQSIFYDNENRPIAIEERHSFLQDAPATKYLLKYDSSNNIIRLVCYEYGTLTTQIEKE